MIQSDFFFFFSRIGKDQGRNLREGMDGEKKGSKFDSEIGED